MSSTPASAPAPAAAPAPAPAPVIVERDLPPLSQANLVWRDVMPARASIGWRKALVLETAGEAYGSYGLELKCSFIVSDELNSADNVHYIHTDVNQSVNILRIADAFHGNDLRAHLFYRPFTDAAAAAASAGQFTHSMPIVTTTSHVPVGEHNCDGVLPNRLYYVPLSFAAQPPTRTLVDGVPSATPSRSLHCVESWHVHDLSSHTAVPCTRKVLRLCSGHTVMLDEWDDFGDGCSLLQTAIYGEVSRLVRLVPYGQTGSASATGSAGAMEEEVEEGTGGAAAPAAPAVPLYVYPAAISAPPTYVAIKTIPKTKVMCVTTGAECPRNELRALINVTRRRNVTYPQKSPCACGKTHPCVTPCQCADHCQCGVPCACIPLCEYVNIPYTVAVDNADPRLFAAGPWSSPPPIDIPGWVHHADPSITPAAAATPTPVPTAADTVPLEHTSLFGNVYVVMPFCNGGDMYDFMYDKAGVARRQLQTNESLRSAFAKIVRGVHSVHAQGYVHRDLSLENVLVHRERDGKLSFYVMDFGQCLFLPRSAAVPNPTTTERVCGKAMYIPPEHFTAADTLMTARGLMPDRPRQPRKSYTRPHNYGYPADVWALGVLLLAMLRNANPWSAHLRPYIADVSRTASEQQRQNWQWKKDHLLKWLERRNIWMRRAEQLTYAVDPCSFPGRAGTSSSASSAANAPSLVRDHDCYDLLRKMLTMEEDARITLQDVLNDAWVAGAQV